MSEDKKTTQVDPSDLYIEPYKDGFTLNCYGEPIRFEYNKEIAVHELSSFWVHVINEFSNFGAIELDEENCYVGPKIISAFAILAAQRLEIEAKDCDFVQNFRDYIAIDNIIRRCAGREVVDQLRRWEPVTKWLEENDIPLPSHPQVVIDSLKEKDVFTTSSDIKFVDFISEQFNQLSNSRKAVVLFFSQGHNAVVFPIVLAQFLCTPVEYANGVMASECLLAFSFGDMTPEEHAEISRNYREDAQTAERFIRAYHNLPLDASNASILKQVAKLTSSVQTSPPKGEVTELDALIEQYKKDLGGKVKCTQDDIARIKGWQGRRVSLKGGKPRRDDNGKIVYTPSNGEALKFVKRNNIVGTGRPTLYFTAKVAEGLAKEDLGEA
jgi:hypothetical protein